MVRYLIAVLWVVVLGLPQISLADRVVRKDGTTVNGRIVEETAKGVVIEVTRGSISARTTIYANEVASIERGDNAAAGATTRPAPTARQEPTFCPLPIMGDIGVDVTADILRAGLREAARTNPSVIVLIFDTPGGSVAECERMLAVLQESKGLPIVALVQKAMSAGAILTMACPKIYMKPNGRIGSAVAYQVGPDGTPENIEEKFRAGVAAIARSAADMGGHSSLLVMGMMDMNLELVVVNQGGKPTVVEAAPDVKGTVLKRKGSILALTANEAVACGLADAVVDDPEMIRFRLGVRELLREDRTGWEMMVRRGKLSRTTTAQKQYMERVSPELAQIESGLAEVQRMRKELEAAHDILIGRKRRDENAVISEYRRRAPSLVVTERAREEIIPALQRDRDIALNRIQATYGPQIEELEAEIAILKTRESALLLQKRRVIDGGPKK